MSEFSEDMDRLAHRILLRQQERADQAEFKNELAYDLWRGWAQEQALAETERRLRREAVRTNGGHSPSRIAVRPLWVVAGAILAVALALVISQTH